jgi:hypothetical protein
MIFRYAVLRLPGHGARIVDLGPKLTEGQAWDAARAACTPSERVDWISSTEEGAREAVRFAIPSRSSR